MPLRHLRQNAFLAAAIVLPLAVVALFLVATAVPRWLVAPPAHDLVFRANGSYDQARTPMSVDFTVRDGRLAAVVRGLPASSYAQVPRLYLFEHATMMVREIAFELPGHVPENGPPVTIPIPALDGKRIVAQARAPDGYELRTRSSGSVGIAGDIFGMRSYRHDAALVNRGRVVELPLPDGTMGYSVAAVGWVIDAGAR